MNAREIYDSWMGCQSLDEGLKRELLAIKDNDKEIEERFYRELEFGTGGLRGILGAGTNRMNIYTVAKATQGLADYIKLHEGGVEKGVAIAFDSRHMSPEFADISASVLNANGIKAYVFESLRPTPELSFAIRHLGCIAGINVTASHNPPEYNGYKVYWEDGAQVSEPADREIMDQVGKVENMLSPMLIPKDEAVKKGLYITIGKEVDDAFMDAVYATVREKDLIREKGKDIKIVYTPLHGAGVMIIPALLAKAGFTDVNIVKEQERPCGDFPTVAYPNPEIPDAMKMALDLAKEIDADIVIGSDPDSDRMGVIVKDKEGGYHQLSGNMAGCILLEYELNRLKEKGELKEDSFAVRSIVSSNLADMVADAYGVEMKEVLTGFKWIGKRILEAENSGKGTFIFGFEESCGYLAGDYTRDKDACGASLSMCEACAYYMSKGLTMYDLVLDMYKRYGYVKEETVSITRAGQEGLKEIASIMDGLRNNPFTEIASYKVVEFRDFEKPEETGFAKTNALYYTLENGWVCVRPSGTEPKIKYYIGVCADSPENAESMVKAIKDQII